MLIKHKELEHILLIEKIFLKLEFNCITIIISVPYCSHFRRINKKA